MINGFVLLVAVLAYPVSYVFIAVVNGRRARRRHAIFAKRGA